MDERQKVLSESKHCIGCCHLDPDLSYCWIVEDHLQQDINSRYPLKLQICLDKGYARSEDMHQSPVKELSDAEIMVIVDNHNSHGFDCAVSDFTCNTCKIKRTCYLAFDPYNIEGDCLANK